MKGLNMDGFGKLLLAAALAALQTAAIAANNDPADPKPDPPGTTPGGEDGKGDKGDPVSAVTGSAHFRVTDVLVPCPGIPLEFSRWYDSSFTNADTSFGAGWRDSLSLRLERRSRTVTAYCYGPPDGGGAHFQPGYATVALGAEVVMTMPDGSRAVFTGESATNGWVVSETSPHRISADALPNAVVPNGSVSEDLYRFLLKDGFARVDDWSTLADDSGPCAGVVYDGAGNAWAFGTNGLPESVTAPGGSSVAFRRGADGRVAALRHSNGLSVDFAYDAAGRLAEASVPGTAYRCSYSRDGEGRLASATRETSSGERAESYAYGFPGNPALLTDRVNAAGRSYHYRYARLTADRETRFVCTNAFLGGGWLRTDLSYAADAPEADVAEWVSATDARRSRLSWDEWGNVVEASFAPRPGAKAAPAAEYGRGRDRTVLSEKRWSSSGDYSSLSRTVDLWRNTVSLRAGFDSPATNGVFSASWHPLFTAPLSVRDADGVEVTFAYDEAGRQTNAVDALGGASSLAWDGDLAASSADPCGRVTSYAYDALGRPSSVTPPAGPAASLESDALGHLRRVSLPGPGGTVREWAFACDELGRNATAASPDGLSSLVLHDPCGNVTSRVSRAGRRVDVSWLPAAHPGSVTRWVDAATPATVSYAYDLLFRTVAVTDPSGREVERYVLDDEDRVAASTNLEGQVFLAGYAAGGVLRTLRRYDGSTVSNALDRLGRVTESVARPADGSASETSRFAYTDAGRLTNAANAAASVALSYDAAGRPVAESSDAGGGAPAWVLASAPDASGIVTNTSLSVNGSPAISEDVALDAGGRLAAVSVSGGGSVSVGYCGWNGLECALTNAAFTVAREHDVLDRVTNIVYTARGGTPLYRLSYAYDPDGLVTQRVVASASGAVTNSYAYDGLMRLVAESDSPGNSASYVYDPCGNRLSVTTPSGTATSTYTHNRRDADEYDAGGRVTRTVNGRGQVLGLAWNLQGELVSVSTNGVFAEGYAYDALGRRISTTDAGGTVYHAYDGIHCVADLAPDGTLLRSYMWGVGIDNLLAVTLYGDSTNTLYAVTDPLGTVHALVGTNGVPAVTYAYDSWGNLLSVSGDETLTSLRFTWQGRECSHATALYNFRARWYDPASGRWLSKDPIGLEGGLNLYEAFGSNPVCFRDPTGKILPLFTGIINGVIGGVIGAICNGVQGKGVLKGALVGAIGGFVTGITFGIAAPAVASCGAGIVIAGGVSGAVGSAASSITDEIISSLNGTDEHCFDWGRVGVAIRNGAITGLGIGVVGAWGGEALKSYETTLIGIDIDLTAQAVDLYLNAWNP